MSMRPGSSSGAAPPVVPAIRLSRDYERAVVAAKRRQGTWGRLTRGASIPASQLRPEVRALATIAAVHERLVQPHWFSHESAALIWGLPLWRTPALTHVRQQGRPGPGRDRAVLRHGGPVDDGRLTTVGHLPVTDLVQTMVDCARMLSALGGLVVADATLRAGADRATALSMLDEMGGRPGVARARVVVDLADDGAESPGETATRFVLLRDGLPRPATQIPILTRAGTFFADLGWEEWRALLEYDGQAKYRSGQDLLDEKLREDAIRALDYRVVRVTKQDIRTRAGLSGRVRALLPASVGFVRRPLLRA